MKEKFGNFFEKNIVVYVFIMFIISLIIISYDMNVLPRNIPMRQYIMLFLFINTTSILSNVILTYAMTVKKFIEIYGREDKMIEQVSYTYALNAYIRSILYMFIFIVSYAINMKLFLLVIIAEILMNMTHVVLLKFSKK